MSFSLGGLFLAVCIVATTATAIIHPIFDLFHDGSDIIHVKCWAFSGLVRMHPLNYPQVDKVSFELRTPCKRTDYPVRKASNLRKAPEFDAEKKTVIFVGGWNSNINDENIEDLTKAYLCRGAHNFIVVNTNDFLKTEYLNSAYNTAKLGEFVALGLKNLNIPATDIHLIGHSLGAHVMGIAARHYTAVTGKKIARVTGLDPARPCFVKIPIYERISATDATFVDIIHSNVFQAGLEEAIGHADFYPNGLRPTQTGCLAIDVPCSHGRSVDYYIESVYLGNENNFMATSCANHLQLQPRKCKGSRVPMGYATNENIRGIYILDVNAKAPHGKNAKNKAYLSLKCGLCTK